MDRKTVLQISGNALLIFSLVLLGCTNHKEEPIRIGLATTLTGKNATSGAHSRNGALLAVEQINRAGGINGRKVELIIRDDKGSIDEAKRVDRELIDAGVVAILGHYLSSLCVETVPIMNETGTLMIGLGSISAELSNLDDNFLRVASAVDIRIPLLAKTVYQDMKMRKVAVFLDHSNPEYTKSCYMYFKNSFEALGGEITETVIYNSKLYFSATELVNKLHPGKYDSILLITNALNGALLSQNLRKVNSKAMIIDSGWGISDYEFISAGGRAVEGAVSIHQFNGMSTDSSFLKFRKDYTIRFGSEFGNTAQRGYEAANILLYALTQTDDRHKLKDIILQKKEFVGVDGKFVINEYGDAIRPFYLLEVEGRALITKRKIEPSIAH